MTGRVYADPAHQPFVFPAGPTHALIIPGFLGTPKELRPLGQALAEAGISARGVLLPGFGPDLGRLAAVRAADWLRVAAEAWDEVWTQAERTVLIGFSMGGAVALHLAARRPPTRLVLLAPHWRFADRRALVLPLLKHVVRAFRPFAGADFADPSVRRVFAEMDPTLDLDDPAVQARLRRETVIPTVTLDELRRLSATAGIAARRVAVPTLILQGQGDAVTLPRYTRRLAGRLRGPATLHELDADHFLVAAHRPAWPTVCSLITAFASAPDGA